jgi:hypothetical protein
MPLVLPPPLPDAAGAWVRGLMTGLLTPTDCGTSFGLAGAGLLGRARR